MSFKSVNFVCLSFSTYLSERIQIWNTDPFFFTYFQSVLSVETNTKNVTAAISVLNSRLGLLEPSHLEHVEGRLAALLQKLNSISEKKAALEDSEKNNKVRAHHMFSQILNFLFVSFVFSIQVKNPLLCCSKQLPMSDRDFRG